ncbi:MAG: hypothetical protein MJ219_01590 [Mycoplasmoidaceae bacterium]|nr:hypothetical protein [Mycoplasmoidaceae bacterium]
MEQSRLPNNIYNGMDEDTEEELVEDQDFKTEGSLNDEYLEVELIGDKASKHIIGESITFELDS